jgi:hypothetical protein
VTVAIDVIAAKQNALMIAVDELLIPTDDFSSGCDAKVFVEELRLIAVDVDVLGSLLSNLDGVTKSLFELCSLSAVAGLMNREPLDFDGGLGVGGCSSTGDSDGGDCSVLDDGRSSSGGSKNCIQ